MNSNQPAHSFLVFSVVTVASKNQKDRKDMVTKVYVIPNTFIDDCLRNHLVFLQGKIVYGTPLRGWDLSPFEVSDKNQISENITHFYQCGQFLLE